VYEFNIFKIYLIENHYLHFNKGNCQNLNNFYLANLLLEK